ncbi:hypothetical protein ABH940_000790 [Streptacidiphilus sp. BW17]
MDSPRSGTAQPANTTNATGSQRPRSVTGSAQLVTFLIALTIVREIVVLAGNWRDYFLIHDYLAGTASAADLESASNDLLTQLSSEWTLLVWFVTGVVFLVWLWRARINAELLRGVESQHRSRPWVIGAWITPVANLWYPYQVLRDIWRASAPKRPAPSLTLVQWWWACFLLDGFLKPTQWRLAQQEASEHDALVNANVDTVLMLLILGAGVFLVLVVRRITAWQTAGLVD